MAKEKNLAPKEFQGFYIRHPATGQKIVIEKGKPPRPMRIDEKKDGGIVKAGKEYSVEEVGDDTYGIDEIPTEWGRKKLDRKTEKLIQGTEFQVRGRYFNDNNGKGTF